MDFSKLGSNEKLAVYGAVATVVGGFIAAITYFTYGGAWIGIIAGIAMLAIVFMPQFSPTTRLPGSKGSLMLIVGGVAGAVLVLVFLINLGFVFRGFGIGDALFIVAVAGGIVMAWAGWQEFQAEGGQFKLGTSGGGAASGSAAAPPAASAEPPAAPAAAPPAAEPAPPPAAPAPAAPAPTAYQPPAAEPASEPMADESAHPGAMPDDEEQRQA
jgi:hypothetical protein